MTDQSKIDRKGARPASLFERAEMAFGLGPAHKPKVPPAAQPRHSVTAPAAQPAIEAPLAAVVTAPASAPAPVAPPAPPKPAPVAVAFTGPRVTIDRDLLRQNGLIVPEDRVTGQLEEFRIVKRELLAEARASEAAGVGALGRRILVCSPHPGEGKTFCATNLAIALAVERRLEVLLVDADVAKPAAAERLGINAARGLMDTLADPAIAPESLVLATDIEGLFVLPAGTPTSRDSEYLASTRTREVLDRLTEGAPDRIVIFDTPPALAASAAAELAAHVGQAVLVVRADETSRAAIDDARQLLSACGDIKLLLNAARYSPSGRDFGTYGTGWG